jgi:hypothetical protein
MRNTGLFPHAIGAIDTAVEARTAVSMKAATSETATRCSDSKRSVMVNFPLHLAIRTIRLADARAVAESMPIARNG